MDDHGNEKQGELLPGSPDEVRPARRRPIGHSQLRLLDAAVDIRQQPEAPELAFLSKLFIQATLPHRNPGNLPLWTRTNGTLTLTVQPAQERGKILGYPYGTVPRLLLFWMTTEALRTKKPRLDLGHSLTTFMRELGLNPDNGSSGAKRSDSRRLRDQMKRLFFSTISFETSVPNNQHTRDTWVRMVVAPKGMLWWDHREPDQNTLWGSWIELNEDFYRAIISTPVPVDLRALRALKHSPLQLDLYAWATYTAYVASKSRESRFVAWRWLHEQFGSDYASVKKFKQNCLPALRSVQAVYPALKVQQVRGGLRVLSASAPSIAELLPADG